MSHHTAKNADSTVVSVKVPDKSLWKCFLNNPHVSLDIVKVNQVSSNAISPESINYENFFRLSISRILECLIQLFWSYINVMQNMAIPKRIYAETLYFFASLNIDVFENENKLC